MVEEMIDSMTGNVNNKHTPIVRITLQGYESVIIHSLRDVS